MEWHAQLIRTRDSYWPGSLKGCSPGIIQGQLKKKEGEKASEAKRLKWKIEHPFNDDD